MVDGLRSLAGGRESMDVVVSVAVYILVRSFASPDVDKSMVLFAAVTDSVFIFPLAVVLLMSGPSMF